MTKYWPLHPRPYPDEALSSWISRLACLYDMEPEELLKYELGLVISYKDLYTLDLDPSTHVFHALSECAGVTFDCVRSLTAQSYLPLLIDTFDTTFGSDYITQFEILPVPNTAQTRQGRFRKGWTPWFNSKRFATMYGCKACLTETSDPYFRLYWRFPWVTCCPTHRLVLRKTICINNQQKLLFLFDNTNVELPALEALCSMDNLTLQAITNGVANVPAGKLHGGIWLRLLRTLIEELQTPVSGFRVGSGTDRKTYRLIRSFWHDLNLDLRQGCHSFSLFENCDHKMQVTLMTVAACVFKSIFSNQSVFHQEIMKILIPPKTYEYDLESRYVPTRSLRPITMRFWQEREEEFNEWLRADPENVRYFREIIKAGKVVTLESADEALRKIGISIV